MTLQPLEAALIGLIVVTIITWAAATERRRR